MSNANLSAGQRLTYWWVRTLGSKDGYCTTRVTEIAGRVGIDPSMCSQHLTVLEKAGYIERVPATGLGKGRRRFKILGLMTALAVQQAIGTQADAQIPLPLDRYASDQRSIIKTQRRRRKRAGANDGAATMTA